MNNIYFRILSISIILVSIISCTSAPVKETNYYLLNNHLQNSSSDNQVNTLEGKPKRYHLNVAELSEYLNQPYLVMQLTEHQLHYARFHMWAEPLDDGIRKALLNDFNNQNHNSLSQNSQNPNRMVISTPSTPLNSVPTLHVAIESFHTTSQSKAILSGYYWIQEATSDELNQVDSNIVRQPFYFETNLQDDGYAHSVLKMRSLIKELSELLGNKL